MSRARRRRRLDPDAPLAENARAILGQRVADLYSFAPIVTDERATAKLHEMRIAAKRLRYTLELFAPVFGASGERQINRVKAIQESLGLVHDADVRMDLIERELTEIGHEEVAAARAGLTFSHAAGDPRPGLLALLARQAAARRAEYQAFVALWSRLNAEGLQKNLNALAAESSPHPAPSGPPSPNAGRGSEESTPPRPALGEGVGE